MDSIWSEQMVNERWCNYMLITCKQSSFVFQTCCNHVEVCQLWTLQVLDVDIVTTSIVTDTTEAMVMDNLGVALIVVHIKILFCHESWMLVFRSSSETNYLQLLKWPSHESFLCFSQYLLCFIPACIDFNIQFHEKLQLLIENIILAKICWQLTSLRFTMF